MALSRYLILFAIVAALAMANVAAEEEEEEEEQDPEQRQISIVIRILSKLFKGAAKRCLGEAANKCKSLWKNPGKLLKCGKDFLAQNKGRCVVG